MVVEVLSNIDILIRLFTSLILGFLIGLERELKGSHAGLRTHSLVCLGSSVFTISSFFITGNAVDASRIPAYIIVGIGFLGGGVIFQSNKAVFGLTTAATLWITAGIGLVVGLGEFFTAIWSSVFALMVIILGRGFEKSFLSNKKKRFD